MSFKTFSICGAKPVNGSIPLWVGGGGEKRTLRPVAQYADGWNYFMTDPQEYQHKFSIFHQPCQDAQRDSKEIRQRLIVRVVLDQDTEAPNTMMPLLGLLSQDPVRHDDADGRQLLRLFRHATGMELLHFNNAEDGSPARGVPLRRGSVAQGNFASAG